MLQKEVQEAYLLQDCFGLLRGFLEPKQSWSRLLVSRHQCKTIRISVSFFPSLMRSLMRLLIFERLKMMKMTEIIPSLQPKQAVELTVECPSSWRIKYSDDCSASSGSSSSSGSQHSSRCKWYIEGLQHGNFFVTPWRLVLDNLINSTTEPVQLPGKE